MAKKYLQHTAQQIDDAVEQVSELSQKVGDIDKLETESHDSIVGAINEVATGSGREIVRVCLSSKIASVAGLTLYVYLNGDTQYPLTVETDDNGVGVFSVSKDSQYRIVFPDIEGCDPQPDIIHTALIRERAIEVEYVAETVENELVNIVVRRHNGNTTDVVAGKVVKLTIGDTTEEHITSFDGKVSVYVPVNTTYTVSIDKEDGYYIPNGYSRTFLSRKTNRYVSFVYYEEQIGFYFVDADGNEYTNREWAESGRDGNEAVFIKIATPELLADDGKGVFYIKINNVIGATYMSKSLKWCNSNIEFTSIPLNGNSAAAKYYYDGFGSSISVFEEAASRSLVVPAFEYACGQSYDFTAGEALSGFIWSVGQNRIVYNNRVLLDDMLALVRPGFNNSFSEMCTKNIWTSTQNNATNAWYVNAGVINAIKAYATYVLVCYAPSI